MQRGAGGCALCAAHHRHMWLIYICIALRKCSHLHHLSTLRGMPNHRPPPLFAPAAVSPGAAGSAPISLPLPPPSPLLRLLSFIRRFPSQAAGNSGTCSNTGSARDEFDHIAAGVIVGTRSYDWGSSVSTAAPSLHSASVPVTPTNTTVTGLTNLTTTTSARRSTGRSSTTDSAMPIDTNHSSRRISQPHTRDTIRRIKRISKSVLRRKPLPPLPTLRRSTSVTVLSSVSLDNARAVRRMSATTSSSVDGLGISVDTTVPHRRPTHRRFSFDSSSDGASVRSSICSSLHPSQPESLLFNAATPAAASRESVPILPPAAPNDAPLDLALPFSPPSALYSAADLAEFAAFDFGDDMQDLAAAQCNIGGVAGISDGTYDSLLDEVNACADDAYYDDEEADYDEDYYDEDAHTASSTPSHSTPSSPRDREVVAYMRDGSGGWVVEHRVRKGGWGNPALDMADVEVEEELIGTEVVARRAI
ncbi:uncharacterized protein V1518DRAFT_216029 [Limtongia smithiae]|uniref:uncharacterized protein n=1 Tax=Limtongia smithiae TaxID=1125753 RepID=UPI0034D013F9